jgi:predicted phage tail protein
MDQVKLKQSVSDFANATPEDQDVKLRAALVSADPQKVKAALASPEVKSNLGPVFFPGVSDHDRMDLYKTILWMLAVLCVIALVGGAVALVAGKESAAFFTFAGLALGGITGILVPSPTSSGSSG